MSKRDGLLRANKCKCKIKENRVLTFVNDGVVEHTRQRGFGNQTKTKQKQNKTIEKERFQVRGRNQHTEMAHQRNAN